MLAVGGAPAHFATSYTEMEQWLFNDALPLWATRGIDPNGGFFGAIAQDGYPVEAPRRTRVIARQIYSFAAAGRMGWSGDSASIVAHGVAALERAVSSNSGLVVAATQADGTVIDARYDFYDHAFALFALANAATLSPHRNWALAKAHILQDAVDAIYRHPNGGFFEDANGSALLRANPHMHMLEACLALASVDDSPGRWQRITDEIVTLALDRFIAPRTGALRELYATDWRALDDAEGQIIEPGHQFEWAWLLAAWNASHNDRTVSHAANRLAQIGRVHGLAASGIVFDELTCDFRVRSARSRAWPQCERLKCHVERALAMKNDAEADDEWHQAGHALGAWKPFLRTAIAGLWFDRLDAYGTPVNHPSPGSTLYHFVCALETAQKASQGYGAASTLRLSNIQQAR